MNVRTAILMWTMACTILTTALCFKQAYDYRSYTAVGGEVIVPIVGVAIFIYLYRKWR